MDHRDRSPISCPPRRCPRWLGYAFALGVALPTGLLDSGGGPKDVPDAEVAGILNDMVARGARFAPEKLHALGVDGLSAVLDWLLPETIAPKQANLSDEAIDELIEQLGDDNFGVREAATHRLYRLRSAVQGPLLEATESADAEIGWRAQQILRRWEAERTADKRAYVAGFSAYVAEIDDEDRLAELAKRGKLALEYGMPGGAKQEILRQCLATVAGSGKDQLCDVFTPLLEHDDARVAVFIAQVVGASAEEGYYPGLLLEALQSERTEIRGAALCAKANAADSPQADRVKRVLVSILEGDDPALQLLACGPLMRAFQDPKAVDYLLAEAAGAERKRRILAISLLGDPCNAGKPAPAKLLHTLVPLLDSHDQTLRRTAYHTLAVYSGEEVINSLIPLLADRLTIVQEEVTRSLLSRQDKADLRRLLAAAAGNNRQSEPVRQAAARLLERIDQQP